MFANIALLALAVLPGSTPRRATPALYRPRIELWTNRGEDAVYTRGERVRVFFKLDRDAFVTIFRVDTDGRVRVLFPREPWEDNFARGGREFEVEGRSSDDAFSIDDYPGVGYIFAVTAADAFTYDAIESGDHWDYRTIADGRVRGDPYVALTELAQRIVPEGYSDWDYDVLSYNVEQRHDYPRFLCYDCHTYVSYPYWDPYNYSCVRFRIVVYDDPWYYPYRYYGGRRVVYARPYRPQPRFIFKDWGGNRPSRDGFVTRGRERPENDNQRRGVTGRDVGGIGSIPAPNVRDRRDRPDQPQRPDDRPNRPDDRSNRPHEAGRPQIIAPREQPPRQEEPRREPVRQVEPRRDQPRQVEPRRDPPRQAEPRREPVRQVEPRRDPPRQAEPRRDPPRQAAPQRDPPRQAAPQREAPKEKPRSEPEVRRRRP